MIHNKIEKQTDVHIMHNLPEMHLTLQEMIDAGLQVAVIQVEMLRLVPF